MRLGLLTLELGLQLIHLLVHHSPLLVALENYLFMEVILLVCFVYLLTSAFQLVLQPNVLLAHTIYFEIPVLYLFLHTLHFPLILVRVAIICSFSFNHIHVEFKLLNLCLQVNLSLTGVLLTRI